MTRKIPFEGDDAAYICFLEARVLQLEDFHRKSSQEPTEIGVPFRSPADINKDRDKNESFTTPHRNTCQIQNPSEKQPHEGGIQPAQEALSEKRQLGKDDGAFEIIEYDPEAKVDDGTEKCKLDQSRSLQLKRLSRFTTFLDDLPESRIWKTWVSAIDDIQRRKLLQELVQTCGSGASSFTSLKASKEFAVVSSKSTSISILSEYANFMISFGMLNQQVACFRNILFVSLCAVALEIVQDKEDVYGVMRRIIGTEASSKQLIKLVRGAKWANSLMSILSRTKWAARSWDILCVVEHPVSFYARLNDYSLKPEKVLDGMKTNIHKGQSLSESTGSSAPLAIPLIIQEIFGDGVSLQVICESLGYELSSLESYRTIFKNALCEGYARKRPALTIFEPSKRHCQDHCSSPRSHQTQLGRCQHCLVTNIPSECSLPLQAQDDTALTIDSAPSANVPGHLHRTDPTITFAPSLNTASQVPTVDIDSNIVPEAPGGSKAVSISIAVSRLEGRNGLAESAMELPQPEPVDAYTKQTTSIQVPRSDTNCGANPSSAPEQIALQELNRGDSSLPRAAFLESDSQGLLEGQPREFPAVGNPYLDTQYRTSPLRIPLELACLPPPCSAYTTVDVRENGQPLAPNLDSYSFVDWERDFLLLDWDRDIDYTSFQLNDGQTQ